MSLSELGEDEKVEYKSLKKRYDRSATKYETHTRRLDVIQTKIQEIVTRSDRSIRPVRQMPPE